MANFVDAVGNSPREYPLINLDQVALLRPTEPDRCGLPVYEAVSASGKELGRISSYHLPVEPSGLVAETRGSILSASGKELGRISSYHLPVEPSGLVAETRGSILIGYGFYNLQESTVFWVQRYPVLAWKIFGSIAEPVICESLPDVWCLEFRTGVGSEVWVFPDERHCASADEAAEHARKRLRHHEEKRRLAEMAAANAVVG